MFQHRLLPLAIAAATLVMTGCNSNDHDNPANTTQNTNKPTGPAMTTVTVTPSLGKILNARVILRGAKSRNTLAIPKVLSNGTAQFTVAKSALTEPVLAEIVPNETGDVSYFDEATEKTTTIPITPTTRNTPLLRAVATVTENTNLGVTALTEAAVQQAEKMTGGLSAVQNINQANAAVKNALNLNFDITQAPVVVGLGEFDKLLNTALDAQRRAYAVYLATLAKEAQRINSASSTPAYDIAKVLASDLSDGAFDAKQGSNVLGFYNAGFVSAWINWVQNFYASFSQLTSIVALNRWYAGFDITNKDSVQNFPDAAPIRTVNGVEEYACSGEGRIKSSSGASIYMDFVNQRGVNMNVYWLDYNAGRVSYKSSLATGQTHNQQTFVTHPWLVTDNTGACIGIYRPVTATKKVLTFKTGGVSLANDDTGTTDTCASKGLPVATLNSIADYNGDYKAQNGNVVFNLNTRLAKASVKGTEASITEVCGPNNQSNGTNHVLITPKGNVTLFKDTADVVTAEGGDFSTVIANDYFFGTKQTVNTNTCSSQGADDKLGFANAPASFCSFTKASSVAIVTPDIYTFFNATKNENVKVTVVSGTVSEVLAENSAVAFRCGGGSPACSGITFQQGTNTKEFIFNNTVLAPLSGAGSALTIKNGSLIHQQAIVTPPTGTCTGNTNPFGCLSITGAGAPASSYEFLGDGVPLYQSAVANTGAVTFYGKALSPTNLVVAGIAVGYQKIAGSTQSTSYTYYQYDSSFNVVKSLTLRCKNENSDCPGLTVDAVSRTISYDNVVMGEMSVTDGLQLTFNGVLKY